MLFKQSHKRLGAEVTDSYSRTDLEILSESVADRNEILFDLRSFKFNNLEVVDEDIILTALNVDLYF